MARLHHRCVGCENQTPTGVQTARNPRESDGGIDAGDAGGGEPPRRMSGGRSGRSRRQSCAARCRRRWRRRPQSCGHDCPARCGAKCGSAPQERAHERRHRGRGSCPAQCRSRCAAQPAPATHGVQPGTEPRRSPQPAQPARASEARTATSAARSAGARRPRRSGGRCGRASSQARRPGTGGERSEPPRQAERGVSASERRREGYPPEGPRPRSGLGRVARSRSDAPRLTLPSGTPGSIIGTIDGIAVSTVVVSTNGRIVITPIGTGVAIVTGIALNAGTVVSARRALPPSVASRWGSPRWRCRSGACAMRCGGRAAEPPRSAAPKAPARREGEPRGGVGGFDQKGERAAPVSDAARDAQRPMRGSAGPGCRAAARGPRGCR